MGATHPIITSRVGDGGQTRGLEVKRIQQLLRLAGSDPGPITGEWTTATKRAWLDFQADCDWGPVNPYIDQEDPYMRLFMLAYAAGVLIELPNNLRSTSAVLSFVETCRDEKIPYGFRTVWGFENYPNYAVVTLHSHRADVEFPPRNPRLLNCSSFVNLMLSIWVQGNIHQPPYERSQESNPTKPLGCRYNLHPARGFDKQKPPGIYKNFDTIQDLLEPDRMYYLNSCDEAGGFHHDMVLLNGTIYQANDDQTPAVYALPLKQQWDRTRQANHFFTIYGPGPY
jgi:hypothetical protein